MAEYEGKKVLQASEYLNGEVGLIMRMGRMRKKFIEFPLSLNTHMQNSLHLLPNLLYFLYHKNSNQFEL